MSLYLVYSEYQPSEDIKLHKPSCSEGKDLNFLAVMRKLH